ncbi:MAG: zinc ribbon domain-containing protein [Candidatus Heimdallarchaeaceae archaeon]
MYGNKEFLKNPSLNFKLSGLFFILYSSISLGTAFLPVDIMSTNLALFIVLMLSLLFFEISSILLLVNAMVILSQKIPPARNDARSARMWLLIFLGATLIASFSSYISEYLALPLGLLALIGQILGFTKLNKTFKKMSQAYPPEGKLDHWIFPFYGYSSLIVVGFSVVITFILVPDIQDVAAVEAAAYTALLVVSVISLLISITLGIVLYRTGMNVAKYEPVDAMMRPETALNYNIDQHQVIEQQIKPVDSLESEISIFCSNCGMRILSQEKFCSNCGFELD